MSNRKKAKRPWLGKGRKNVDEVQTRLGGTLAPQNGMLTGHDVETGEIISVPMDERVVNKTVPAVIHYAQWEQIDRDDDEIIGETVIYEDGSFEMVVRGDISPEAQSIVNFLHAKNPFNVSLAKEETDGSA